MLIKDRKYALTIGDTRTGDAKVITNLNITFNVKSTTNNSKQSNKAMVTVFNLNDESIKALEDEDYLFVRLDVGYETTGTSTILAGDVISVKTEKRGSNRITSIVLSEGYSALNFIKLNTVIKPTTVGGIINEILKRIPTINKGEFSGNNIERQVTENYPLVGSPKQMLDEIADAFQIQYQVINNVLYVSDEGGSYSKISNEIPLFKESTGLVGIPHRHIDKSGKRSTDKTSKNGISFKALLNPYVKTGDLVKIESDFITGIYKIKEITYVGEFRGRNWYIDCICEDFLQSVEG